MQEDWASHRHVCSTVTQAHVGADMWAVEAEVNHMTEKEGEQWVPTQLVHYGRKNTDHHPVRIDNELLVEEIGARADFQSDLSVVRGIQRLPSGSMHNGEKVSVFVKTPTFQTEVVVSLPSRAHYNIFKRNGGYNVFLTQQDIRNNRNFRPVPLSGLFAVGLGTAEQKALVYGNYSITRVAPDNTALRFLDFARRFARRPRLVRLRAIDRSTQMAVSVTLEQAVSVGSEGIGNADAVYNISYVEIYVPYLYTGGAPADQSWDAVFADELALSDDATKQLNEELRVESAIACLSDQTPEVIENVVKNYDGFDALHQDDAVFVANAISAFIAEEIGAESPFEGGEALEDCEDGLIGSLVTDGMAEVHYQNGAMELDEIGANVISRWLNRRRAKRAAKKQQQQQRGDEQIQAHLDTIDAPFRDWVSRKRNLSKNRSALSKKSAPALEKMLIDTVKQIQRARSAGSTAGDKVRLANSIVTELDNKGVTLTPAAQEARAALTNLSGTTKAVASVKRKKARAEAERVKQAGRDAINSTDSITDTDTESVESAAQTAALVSALLHYQDVIRADKKSVASQGKMVTSAATRLDEDLSKITSILSQHVEALCTDPEYNVIPETVVNAFDRALSLHKQLCPSTVTSGAATTGGAATAIKSN